jgi:hypothetical protein
MNSQESSKWQENKYLEICRSFGVKDYRDFLSCWEDSAIFVSYIEGYGHVIIQAVSRRLPNSTARILAQIM